MKYLVLILLLLATNVTYGQYISKAYGFTNTTVPGYDAKTNPNRTGIVSVSLNENNKAYFYLADPIENPKLPHDVQMGYEQHYCIFNNNEYSYQSFQYAGVTYLIDIVLDADNSLYVYIDDMLIDTVENFCETE